MREERSDHAGAAHGRLPESEIAGAHVERVEERLQEDQRGEDSGLQESAERHDVPQRFPVPRIADAGAHHLEVRFGLALLAIRRLAHREGDGHGGERDARAEEDRGGKRRRGGDRRADEDGEHDGERRERPHAAVDLLELLFAAHALQAVVEQRGVSAGLQRQREAPCGVGQQDDDIVLGDAEDENGEREHGAAQHERDAAAVAIGDGARRHFGEDDEQEEGRIEQGDLGEREVAVALQIDDPDGPP